jgi:hypothetical protein
MSDDGKCGLFCKLNCKYQDTHGFKQLLWLAIAVVVIVVVVIL